MKAFECWKCNAYVKHGMGVNLGKLIPDLQDENNGIMIRVCWGCWNNSRSNLFDWREEE